ncbi:MAG TPA: hypothetical protein VFI37_14855, partial [Gaiellaceae bacterium]|nr:hypothetical protein [Gaiellaceae bacterium]
MPRDTPEWSGETPDGDPWPRRPESEQREERLPRPPADDPADELAEDPFAERLPLDDEAGDEEPGEEPGDPVAVAGPDEAAEAEEEAEE